MQDDDARSYRHDHRAQTEIDRLTAAARELLAAHREARITFEEGMDRFCNAIDALERLVEHG